MVAHFVASAGGTLADCFDSVVMMKMAFPAAVRKKWRKSRATCWVDVGTVSQISNKRHKLCMIAVLKYHLRMLNNAILNWEVFRLTTSAPLHNHGSFTGAGVGV